MNNYHKPVLLQEVLTYLAIQAGEKYIDCTLGGGGHTMEIIRRGGKVLGIDVDEDAIAYVRGLLRKEGYQEGNELTIAQGNFSSVDVLAGQHGFDQVDGILMDIGVSSYQLDKPERGFSFHPGPLDMRMDQTLSVTASDLVNGLTEKELTELFERLGEERFAKKIAKVIVQQRKESPIRSTSELADLIKSSVYRSEHDIHPATRVFQALRIAVNDELNVLREALPKAFSLLQPGGKLVVISFHSLEDRIVKHTFDEIEKTMNGEVLTKKPVKATEEEVLQNKRARSAKLRCIKKNN